MNDVVSQPPVQDDKKVDSILDTLPKFEREKVFTLVAPIQRKDGQLISEIILRSPTFFDITELGSMPTGNVWTPVGMRVVHDVAAIKQWMQRLADQELPVLYQLSGIDYARMREWIIGQLSIAGGN